MHYASGKYICFVDPDDYVLENSFRRIIDRMEEESLDVLRFGYTEVDENYQPTKSCKHPEEPDYSSKIMDGFSFMADRLGIACYVWTYMFRTSLLKENDLYFLEGVYFDDTPWLPKVLALAKKVDSMDLKRYFYLIRSNSLVQSVSRDSIRRKIEGQRFLISELMVQNKTIDNEKANIWYQRMVAHRVITLLTLVSIHDFSNRLTYIKELRSRGVLLFANHRLFSRRNLKLMLVSYFPSFFCWGIHVRN
jgi:glycosyltransferase involved in cell wall biosynthesis